MDTISNNQKNPNTARKGKADEIRALRVELADLRDAYQRLTRKQFHSRELASSMSAKISRLEMQLNILSGGNTVVAKAA